MTSNYDSLHIILPTNTKDHILAEILSPHLVRLPLVKLPPDYQNFGHCHQDAFERFVQSQLALRVHLARRLPTQYDFHTLSSDSESNDFLYLAYLLDEQPSCENPLTWIHRQHLRDTTWVSVTGEIDDHDFIQQLEDIFKQINRPGPSPIDRPWQTFGWFQDLTTWVRAVLNTRNISMHGHLRKHYMTVESLVMQCQVGDGAITEKAGERAEKTEAEQSENSHEVVFVKNTLPFSTEVQRTVAVASVVGRFAPEILGFDEQKGRIILRDCGLVTDEPIDDDVLLDTVVKMQCLSTTFISQLEARGLEIRDSEWVEANIESTLNHVLLDVYYGGKGPLPFHEQRKDVVMKVRQKIGVLKERCQRVTKLGLPRTLVHGDLYHPNVGSRRRRGGDFYPFFDWARSFIGNPLHDFGSLLHYRYNEDSENGKKSAVEFKNGLRHICKQWPACSALTVEEMKSMFDITSDMNIIIAVHELTEQYDACDKTNEFELNFCVDELRQWIGDLINKPSL